MVGLGGHGRWWGSTRQRSNRGLASTDLDSKVFSSRGRPHSRSHGGDGGAALARPEGQIVSGSGRSGRLAEMNAVKRLLHSSARTPGVTVPRLDLLIKNFVEAMGLEPTNLLTASQALYQLSYAPSGGGER